MQTSGASRREIANAYSVVIVREGGRSSIPETSVMKSISRSVLDTPHARGMTVAHSPAVIVREGGRSSIPETSVMESISRSVLDTPHTPAASLQRRISGAVEGDQSGICAKTLSFFGASRACSIDFG
jgi:hypothetical protein